MATPTDEDLVQLVRTLNLVKHAAAGLADAIAALRRKWDEARADAEEWRDKYDTEHKAADELSIKLDGARKDWSLQSKISNGYAEALIAAEKKRDEALKERDAAEWKVEKLREALELTIFSVTSLAKTLGHKDGSSVMDWLEIARAALAETETK